MYCVKCGVKLAAGEKKCPLCGVSVYHPELPAVEGDSLYPPGKLPEIRKTKAVAVVLSVLMLIPIITVLLCDLMINKRVVWSGYVVGSLLFVYVTAILPTWFRRPDASIILPCSAVVAALYLMYINYKTEGNWFLTFALPIVASIGLVGTVMIILLKLIKNAKLYISGAVFILTGVVMIPFELLSNYTFGIDRFIGWALYPLVSLTMIGILLIFLAAYAPARKYFERLFFF